MTDMYNPSVTQDKEQSYFQFFYSLLTFHLHFFQLINREKADEEYLLVQSIHLIWQMHVTIFSIQSHTQLANHQSLFETCLTDDQVHDVINRLNQLKERAEKHPFNNHLNKKMYINFIDCIQQFYISHTVIIDDVVHQPWFPTHVKTVLQKVDK